MLPRIYLRPFYYVPLLTVVAFFASPAVLILTTIRKYRQPKLKRILVVPQLTRIGDVICSTHVFRAIKKKYPTAHLAVLGADDTEGVLKNNPWIDELIIFEEFDGLQILKKIVEGRYDAGISLSGTAQSSLLFFFGLIPLRIKLSRINRPVIEWLTDGMNTNLEQYEHHAYLPEFFSTMLRHIGIRPIEAPVIKEIFTSLAADEKAKHFIAEHSLVGKQVVGVSISAGNKVKEWGIEKFAELCRMIRAQFPELGIVFIGSKKERPAINRLVSLLGEGYPIATDLTLEEFPSLMKLFSIFVSVDTGPMHIADALSVPLVDILGPTHPNELTPRGPLAKVVKPSPDIAPSIFAFRDPGPVALSRKAIDSITPSAVFEAFTAMLSLGKPKV